MLAIIEAWSHAMRVETFFAEAQRHLAALSEDDRRPLIERIALARKLLGGVDALRRFEAWKAPDERL